MRKRPDNFLAYLFINALYLLLPVLLFYAPFHTGDYWFFRILRCMTTMFCGYFAIVTRNGDDYYTDSNAIYPKIFLGLALFFGISCLPFLIEGIRFSLPRKMWNGIDFLAGGFLVFYYIERKIDHRR
jgi:hypothetical protein